MANKKKKRKGGKSMTRTAFKLIRLGALAAPGIYQATRNIPNEDKIDAVISVYTGYSMKHGWLGFGHAMQGWGPYIIANLMTHGIPKLTSIIRRL